MPHREKLRTWPYGRWVVVIATTLGVALLVVDLLDAERVALAFAEGAGVAFGVMVLAALGQRLWEGARATSAQAPGGWGIGFGPTKRVVGQLNERITSQMGTINQRIYDLEKVVFKEPNQPAEGEE